MSSQNKWVDLTDDEIVQMWNDYQGFGVWVGEYSEIAYDIIAKFKSKNTQPVVPQEPVKRVVLLDGLPTLLSERAILPTDQRLYTTPPSVAEWEKLRNPIALHQNLLRGLPAQLTPDMLKHLLGNEFDKAIEAAIEATKEKAAKVCKDYAEKCVEAESWEAEDVALHLFAAIMDIK